MDKLIISTMGQKPEPRNPNHLFAIVDVKKREVDFINLEDSFKNIDVTHGMGMNYCGKNLFIAGIIPPQRLRCASFLLIIDLLSGQRHVHNLNFVKAVHGLCAIDNCRLIVNSTQTDILADISIYREHLNEDIFYDFRNERNLENVFTCFMQENQDKPYWRVSALDDAYHINGVTVSRNKIYVTMFNAFDKKNRGKNHKGILYNITDSKLILNDLNQPHTPYIDSKGYVCCADSGNFSFVRSFGPERIYRVQLDGYTRGICEDPARKGFWVGISAYRKYSKTQNRWVEQYKGDTPLKGAKIQFVNQNNEVKDTIDLAKYGIMEIFDILPCLDGQWQT
jgi:hypothetical protein